MLRARCVNAAVLIVPQISFSEEDSSSLHEPLDTRRVELRHEISPTDSPIPLPRKGYIR